MNTFFKWIYEVKLALSFIFLQKTTIHYKKLCAAYFVQQIYSSILHSFFIDEHSFWINSANKNTLIPKFLVY